MDGYLMLREDVEDSGVCDAAGETAAESQTNARRRGSIE
jgi:hypothetical protein